MGERRLRELGEAQTGAPSDTPNYYASGQKLRVLGPRGCAEVFGSWAGDPGGLAPGLTNQAAGASFPFILTLHANMWRGPGQNHKGGHVPGSLPGSCGGCSGLRLAFFWFRLPV